MSRKEMIEKLAESVLDEFLVRVDPAEKRWPTGTSFAPLHKSLYEWIDGAIEDWESEVADNTVNSFLTRPWRDVALD
jgi:hypothetical protein